MSFTLQNAISVERQNSFITDKTIKYDRQLRLWQEWGQKDLENSRICLINANATGTETLKNVILPCCGYFTIIDDNLVTEEDLSNNFFVCANTIGQSRAKVTCEYLRELNQDVVGNYLEDNIDRILQSRPEFFKQFSLIIASNLLENSLKVLADYLWTENIPLIILRSYGLIGSIRLIVKEHTIIEAHPDNELPDLRLDKPFQDLIEFCNSIDLNNMNKKEHSHVPYLVILYKYLQIWKSQNDGKLPSNYKEKEKFKELISSGYFKNEHNVPVIEENFEEALKNVNNSIIKTQIPSDILALFEDEKCLNINSQSKPFWILIRALKDFIENEGCGLLPLRGSIPDMLSDSERFIALQNIYRKKAQNDLESITSRVEQLLYNIDKPYDYIPEHQIKLFCKNAYFLKVIRGRSLNSEYDPQNSKLGILLEENQESDLLFYVLLRACNLFYNEHNRFPGADDSQILDSDIVSLKKQVNKILLEYGINSTIKDDYLVEICRYGNSELHSIAAFIGGCAAHETIKLLTSQFVPINNTFIYNAVKQTTSVYEL